MQPLAVTTERARDLRAFRASDMGMFPEWAARDLYHYHGFLMMGRLRPITNR